MKLLKGWKAFMRNTVVIGTVFVDIKGFSKNIYEAKSRNLGDVKIVHGGVGRNVAENFANVGMPVSFVGMFEDSSSGRDVEQRLIARGVNLDHKVENVENGVGKWLVILDEKGEVAGSVSSMPDVTALEMFLAQNGEEIIAEAESVILEIDLNEAIAEMVVRFAKKHGKCIYSIVGNMSVALARRDILSQTDCFICNEIEAAEFFAEKAVADFSPRQMLKYLPEAANAAGITSIVVTMGAQGAVYFDGITGSSGICPPLSIQVIDTSGAGDAFFSGTVMGLIRGCCLADAVQYGTRLAAATICGTENNCPVDKAFFEK